MQSSATVPEGISPTRKIETIRNHQTGVISCRTPVGSTILVFPDGEVQVSHPDRNTVVVIDPKGHPHEYLVSYGDELQQRNQRGSILLEVALTIPVLLLLILGGIDLSLLATARSNTNYLAEAAGRCQQTGACDPTTSAQNNAAGLGMDPNKVTVSTTDTTTTVQYQWSPLSPFFTDHNLTATVTTK